jgi:ketosteroid isomerase-like protein
MARCVVLFSAFLLLCSMAIAQDSSAPAQPEAAPGAQAAAPAAGSPATSTVSPEIRDIQKIEDNWSGAINQRDQYALELVLSPLFVDVSAVGDVTTRNQQVANLIAAEDKTLHLDQKVITVRMLGDIAVANGTYVLHHRVGSATVDEKGVFTHVFEKVRNGWLCINSQRTTLRADSNAKTKKQSNSNAELPFHIPLFSKN